MPETPVSLLERLRLRPDESSWRRLVDLYTPLIRAWLRLYSLPEADADDLVQEVLAVFVCAEVQCNQLKSLVSVGYGKPFVALTAKNASKPVRSPDRLIRRKRTFAGAKERLPYGFFFSVLPGFPAATGPDPGWRSGTQKSNPYLGEAAKSAPAG